MAGSGVVVGSGKGSEIIEVGSLVYDCIGVAYCWGVRECVLLCGV